MPPVGHSTPPSSGCRAGARPSSTVWCSVGNCWYCGLLEHLGYDIRFDELPDGGHAYPYRFHRERVLPWFEQMMARVRTSA